MSISGKDNLKRNYLVKMKSSILLTTFFKDYNTYTTKT